MIVYQKYIPKKLKFKKIHKQIYRLKGFYFSRFLYKQNPFIFCKIKTVRRLLPHHFESFRRVIKRAVKRYAQFSFYSMCDLPITTKKSGVRMGKGKAAVENWCFSPKIGFIFSSLSTSNYKSSFFSCSKAIKKLPLKIKIVRNKFYIFKKNLTNCIE